MQSIESWLGERLSPLDEATFSRVKHRLVPSALKMSSSVAYFSVPLASGVGSAVLISPAGIGKESSYVPLVIMLHGLGDDCTYPCWHWMHALVAQGIAVLSVDWDGHGASVSSHLDVQQATRSVPLILQKLYGNLGEAGYGAIRPGPDCFLMGFAAGAALALMTAARPEMVDLLKGVIAISPTVILEGTVDSKTELLNCLRPFSVLHDVVGRISYYGVSGVLPALSQKRKRNFPLRMRVGSSPVDQMRVFVNETFQVRKVLRQIQIPVLWMHGRKDQVAPYEKAMELMTEIPAAMFSYVDESRGHLRMSLSEDISTYAATFVDSFRKNTHPY